MQIVKLRKVGNSTTITLPEVVVEALHLHENDEIAIEIMGDHIVLKRAPTENFQDDWEAYKDFQDAWEAYKDLEPRYRNANRKLGE